MSIVNVLRLSESPFYLYGDVVTYCEIEIGDHVDDYEYHDYPSSIEFWPTISELEELRTRIDVIIERMREVGAAGPPQEPAPIRKFTDAQLEDVVDRWSGDEQENQ